MIKRTIVLFIWTSLALYCFAAAATEIPKECTVGTPDYNETLCSETCIKDIHMNQSYCGNFTKPTATVLSSPQQPETHSPTATSEVTLLQEAVKNEDLSTPKTDVSNVPSSGISLRFSQTFSVSCFLLCYILI